jgi:hypothetical protein
VRPCGIWILVAVVGWGAQSAAAAPPAVRSGAPVSAHAMVHTCCTPLPMKERIFAEAKAMGARFIRVDVELRTIFPPGDPSAGPPDWARLDEVLELSRRYDLPALGILLSPPDWVAPHEAQEFGALAAEVAAHARDTITRWEIFTEPNANWGFPGTPEDYAHVLRAAHDAIKARVPEAQLALGGVIAWGGPPWLERVLATPGADAAHAFDIAAVNLRDNPHRLPRQLAAWRALLARHGFTGPVWITEHGYPADPTHQNDPAFHGGEAAQAAFLTESVLSLAEGGADEVFVTLRDEAFLPDSFFDRFLSEGVVSIADVPPYTVRRRPAFAAVRRLVDNWAALFAAHTERRLHEEAMRQAQLMAARAGRNVQVQRKRFRAARRTLRRLQARSRRARLPAAQARLRRQVTLATWTLRDRRSGVGWARASALDYELRAALHGQRATELAAFVAGG